MAKYEVTIRRIEMYCLEVQADSLSEAGEKVDWERIGVDTPEWVENNITKIEEA